MNASANRSFTASPLIRIDAQGRALSPTPHEIDRAGFLIHGTIHEARPDVQCVLHTHTRAGVAVSAQRDGLYPSQLAWPALLRRLDRVDPGSVIRAHRY